MHFLFNDHVTGIGWVGNGTKRQNVMDFNAVKAALGLRSLDSLSYPIERDL